MLQELIRTRQSETLWKQRLESTGTKLLSALVQHSFETVPFYRELISRKGVADRFTLPLVSRSTIGGDAKAFQSTFFSESEVRWRTTSGSTGEPLRICFDPASLYGDVFDHYYDFLRFIPSLTRNPAPGSTAMVIVNDNPVRIPTTIVNPVLNMRRTHTFVLGINDANDETLVKLLRQMEIPVLSGRPRALKRLADLDLSVAPNSSVKIRPTTILASGDNLHSDVRRYLELHYGCLVQNLYASQEGGIIGIECEHQSGLHLLCHRVKLEVIMENGELQSEGSGEFVVTNYRNWAMPFIRYRTGDYGTVKNITCRCGYKGFSIVEISGRDSVYFFFGNQRINPSVFNDIFERLPVRQFQVVQDIDESITVYWLVNGDQEIQRVTEYNFLERFRQIVGSKYPTHVKFVSSVEESISSKKIQRYVSKIKADIIANQ